MRKPLVGIVALVATVVGVSACQSHDTAAVKQRPPQPAPVLAEKTGNIKLIATSGSSAAPEAPAAALDATPKPRHTLVLGEGKGGFKFRSRMLSDEATAKIADMFTGEGAVADLKIARFEIEGHTDNLGSKQVNDQMGLARAEAVRHHLSEVWEIPMDRISVVSYGMDKPIADNSTPEGRAMNRRVVIKVVD